MMKIRVKPLLVALALAGLSGPALAQNNMVTVPIFDGGIVVGVTGLYFVPSATDSNVFGSVNFLRAATVFSTPVTPGTSIPTGPTTITTTVATGSKTINSNPDYQWGFALHLGYVIPGTGNDVMLNWNHLHGSGDNGNTNDSGIVLNGVTPVVGAGFQLAGQGSTFAPVGAPINGTLALSGAFIQPFIGANGGLGNLSPLTAAGEVIPYTYGAGSSSTDWDAVDLNFGQHVNIGGNFDLRAFGGLAWAKVDNDIGAYYAGANFTYPGFVVGDTTVLNTNVTHTILREDTSFRGFGPELGFDGHYCFTNTNFGVSGHIGTAMLIGNTDTDLGFITHNVGYSYTATPGVVGAGIGGRVLTAQAASAVAHYVSDSQNHRLVPELEANLGIDYTYNFANDCNSSLVTTLGYQATNYFNALRSYDNVAGTRLESEDAFFHGPFLTIKFLA
jgi:Legionella pneumophila major outer membrane protein precursor